MSVDTVLVTEVTDDYTQWRLLCPVCLHDWDETTHSLWNVAHLTCPSCHHPLAIPTYSFHGDDNASHDT